MSKKIVKNLYSKTASVLNESLVKDTAELLGVEEAEVSDAVDALSFADYLQLGNAVDIGDVDSVREMLALGDLETEAPALEESLDMSGATCEECGKGVYTETSVQDDMHGVLHCDECNHEVDRWRDGLGEAWHRSVYGQMADENRARLKKIRDEERALKKAEKAEWDRKYGAPARRRKSKEEREELDRRLFSKVENAIGNSFPDGDPMDWFVGFLENNDLDMNDVDRVMKKNTGRKYDHYLIDMWDSYAVDSASDANMYISQGMDPGNSPFWRWDGESPKVELEDNPWGSYPGSRWHKKGVNEADNPSVTPPSQGMASTSNLSKTGDESKLVKRKDVDDLMFGDEVEVADVDGQPTAAKVIMPKGPGQTVVVKGKGGNEVILKKDSIIGTPKVNEEAVSEGYNLAGWDITDKSRLGGGTDPTWITKWIIRGGDQYRPGGRPVYLEVEEIFGDWYLTDKHAGGRSGALTSKQISQYLVDYGVPPVERIGDFLDSHRTYADAENGPSPRDLMDSADDSSVCWACNDTGIIRADGQAINCPECNALEDTEEKLQAQYKKLAGINETASGGATGAGAIATAPMPSKPAPKSRKKSNASRKKK